MTVYCISRGGEGSQGSEPGCLGEGNPRGHGGGPGQSLEAAGRISGLWAGGTGCWMMIAGNPDQIFS